MNFERETEKSVINKNKHGIDFDTAKNIWLDDERIEIKAPYPAEERWIVIGSVRQKVWAAIYTIRGDIIRIISVRRARKKEVKLYEEKILR